MLLECHIVILAVIAEYPSASIELTAIAQQAVPVVMTDFVPEVTEQRAVWLSHGVATPLSFDIVGFRKCDRDQAIIMASHHLRCSRAFRVR
jgi:hypothetical protein